MNKQLAKPKLILILILIIITLTLFLNKNAKAAQSEIDIDTNRNNYFFQVGNLKPGDWMPRNITISNGGIQNFRYSAYLGKKKSSKGLLENLDLKIKKDNDFLYEGKLKDFQRLEPRKLQKGSSETLFVQVSLPYELGNEFQDSSAEVEIIFLAEGDNLDGPPGDNPSDSPDDNPGNNPGSNNSGPNNPSNSIIVNPKMTNHLPNTATNIYNIMLLGGVLLGSGSLLLFLYFRKIRLSQLK